MLPAFFILLWQAACLYSGPCQALQKNCSCKRLNVNFEEFMNHQLWLYTRIPLLYC